MDITGKDETAGGFKLLGIDVCLQSTSLAKEQSVEQALIQLFSTNSALLIENSGPFDVNKLPNAISKHISSMLVSFNENEVTLPICVSLEKYQLDVFVYRLQEEEVAEEVNDSGELANFQVMGLPHKSLDGLWEALVYSDSIKVNLLNYVSTAMLYSQRRVDPHIIGWNRVVLLHGPPGTGKTSLCKALAHKLSLRLRRQFDSYHLIEINAHSLFSKWFSESGKLVMKMFGSIREFASDPEQFVCILIDEVESLTAARTKAMQGSEPSDAIRVVNAVLTELDKIKALPNVLVMTTSNITGAIDEAFLDRADIVQYIGPPDAQARYEILAQCLNELAHRNLLAWPSSPSSPSIPSLNHSNIATPIIPKLQTLFNAIHTPIPQKSSSTDSHFNQALLQIVRSLLYPTLHNASSNHDSHPQPTQTSPVTTIMDIQTSASLRLLQTALNLTELSGRALRKIPFVAASVILEGATNVTPYRFAEAIEMAGAQFSKRSSASH